MTNQRFGDWLKDYQAERIPDDMKLWNEIEFQMIPTRRKIVISRVGWLVAILMLIMTTAGVYALDQILNNQTGDKGMDAVTEQGKVAELYITNQIGGDYELSVTLQTIYADSNRVFVAISASGTAPVDDTISLRLTPYIVLPNGDELPFLGFGGGGGGGGSIDSDRVPIGIAINANFDASLIAITEPELNLIIRVDLAYTKDNDMVYPQQEYSLGETQFEATVPFNRGVTLTPNQTVMGDGIEMRLQKVVIAPSLTRLELCYVEPAQPEADILYPNVWQPVVSLHVNNEAILENIDIALSELDYRTETGCYTYNVTESLDSYAGEWAFSVDYLGYQLIPPMDELQQAFDEAGLPFVAMEGGGYMLARSEANPHQTREDVPEDYEELQALSDSAQAIYQQWREKIEGAWTFIFTVPEA